MNCKLNKISTNKNFWFTGILFYLGPASEMRGRLFYFSHDELSARRACLSSFCFIFNSSERSCVENCVFLYCSSRWHSSTGRFFSRVTLISAVWSMFVRWKVARIFLFMMHYGDRGLWISMTEFSEIKAQWFVRKLVCATKKKRLNYVNIIKELLYKCDFLLEFFKTEMRY